MDQTEKLLKEITEIGGVPGYEGDVRALMRQYLEDVAVVEQAPTIEERARSVFMLLAPKPADRQPDPKKAKAKKTGAKATEKTQTEEQLEM